MATVRREIEIDRDPAAVWDAIRDVGRIHERLVPGFVADCRLEGDTRVVTFGNGMVARELIIAVDDATRRHAWSARNDPFVHHNASAQVFEADDGRSRVVWIADLMPHELAGKVGEMMEQGLQAMKRTLEGAGRISASR